MISILYIMKYSHEKLFRIRSFKNLYYSKRNIDYYKFRSQPLPIMNYKRKIILIMQRAKCFNIKPDSMNI